MRTAKECSKPTPSGYTFGVDAARTANALRDLAAMIESGLIAVESARVQTLASCDDWTTTLLRLKLQDRRPE